MEENQQDECRTPTCRLCRAELSRGRGDFYVVRIEAIADPSPPEFTEEDLLRDPQAEIQRLIEAMQGLTEKEAMDQVYRQLTVCLCTRCYRRWIEELED
jgi:hypothetical protein